jgi:hypothetical protein
MVLFEWHPWAIVALPAVRYPGGFNSIIEGFFPEKRIQCGLIRAMLHAGGDITLAGKERVQRFGLQIPMSYRVNGAIKWRRRVTKNIGCSGVLFRGKDLGELGS